MMAQLFSSMPKEMPDFSTNGKTKQKDDHRAFMETLEGLLKEETTQPFNLRTLLSQIKTKLEQAGVTIEGKEMEVSSEEVDKIIEGISEANLATWVEAGMPEEVQSLFQMEESEFLELNQTSQTNFISALQHVTEQLDKKSPNKKDSFIFNMRVSSINMSQQAGQTVNSQAALEDQAEILWNNFDRLSTQLLNASSDKNAAKPDVVDQRAMMQLTQLLEQVTKLNKQVKDQSSFQETLTKFSKQGTSEQQQLFAHLVKNFSDRNSMPYQQHSTVRSKDVAKWAAQFLSNTAVSETVNYSNGAGIHTSMSKLEQYAIHVNQTNSQSAMQQQFMEQFEQLIKSSRLFQNGSGQSEMNIRLKPHQLGEMNVKVLHMNGEMAVKITVSTSAAKDMLESNMNQLRHLFSPQQVVIEKSDLNTGEQMLSQEEKSADGFKEQSSSQNQNDEESEGTDDEREELSFKELLVNEKV
ncbi:flagellar hook-length control protein FliK [Halobacillus sp. B23F22_1]|uniref:flagellar hook-length control protein FliK n=1 Tax=Halobacillus sp. B23F22_1 TaxID=3459514 RepID=UPI00373E982F